MKKILLEYHNDLWDRQRRSDRHTDINGEKLRCYNWVHSSGKIKKCKVNWRIHLNNTHTDVTINSILVERTGLIDNWLFPETLALLSIFGCKTAATASPVSVIT